MRFRIEATCCIEHEELIEEYPCLHNFGYEEETVTKSTKIWIRDECGNRMWQEGPPRTEYISYININSIEELNRLCEAVANPLVYDGSRHDCPTIEIYDGYRE